MKRQYFWDAIAQICNPILCPTHLLSYLPTSFWEHPWGAILETRDIWSEWDIWDTDSNWEPKFLTIFVIWQLRMTLDSIRNFFQSDSQSMSHWQWQGHLRAKFHIVISNFQWLCQSNNIVEQKICPDTFLLQLIFLLANHKGRRSIRFSHQKSERCPKESKRSALRNENRKECQVYQNYNLRLHSAGGCQLE